MKRTLWLLAALLGFAPSAHAHLMNTGFGPFYDGLAHLFVTPEDLLPVIALALLAGLRGPGFGRAVLWLLPLAWLVGGFVPVPATWPVATALVTVAFGGLVAADRPLPGWTVVGGAILLGLLHGSVNGTEFDRQRSGGLAIAGVAVSLFVVVSLLAGQAAAVRSAWARLVVRVAGSWIAASGLFMLGWSVRAAR